VDNLYECSRWHPWKMHVIKKKGSNFTNTWLTRENSLSECLTSKGTRIATGVVRSKRFLIDWLKNWNLWLLDVSHLICPTCSLISEFRLEAIIKALSYHLYGFSHSLVTLHGAIDINIGLHRFNVRSKSQDDCYIML
jgi:hypothetical protein